MRCKKIVLLLLVFALNNNVAWAQQSARRRRSTRTRTTRKTPPPPSPLPSELITSVDPNQPTPDNGEVDGQIYTNHFFGFQLTYPDGWFVLNQAGQQEATEAGARVLGLDEQKQATIARAAAHTINLFAMTQYLTPPPGQGSANLLSTAEQLKVVNLTPAQYLVSMRDGLLPRMGINFDVAQDVQAVKIGGRSFATMTLNVKTSTLNIKQKYYVTIAKGYVLFFALTYLTDEQLAVLDSTMNSLTFTDAK
jgi:hypothetical protein